jgi:hypothetical protein
LRAGAN